jgi:hypothetical protein
MSVEILATMPTGRKPPRPTAATNTISDARSPDRLGLLHVIPCSHRTISATLLTDATRGHLNANDPATRPRDNRLRQTAIVLA